MKLLNPQDFVKVFQGKGFCDIQQVGRDINALATAVGVGKAEDDLCLIVKAVIQEPKVVKPPKPRLNTKDLVEFS